MTSCAVPHCESRCRNTICARCRRELPAWLVHSRGRSRADMIHDIEAFFGAAPVRPVSAEQPRAWKGESCG